MEGLASMSVNTSRKSQTTFLHLEWEKLHPGIDVHTLQPTVYHPLLAADDGGSQSSVAATLQAAGGALTSVTQLTDHLDKTRRGMTCYLQPTPV